jgi:aspartate/methionine/tyrosine aminotransferase
LNEGSEGDPGEALTLIAQFFDNVGQAGNSINLGIGELDHDLFDALKEEAVRRILAGHNKYTQTAGIPDLREAIAEYYRRRVGLWHNRQKRDNYSWSIERSLHVDRDCLA